LRKVSRASSCASCTGKRRTRSSPGQVGYSPLPSPAVCTYPADRYRGDIPVAGNCTGPGEILDGFLAQLTATLDPATPVTQDLHRITADGDSAPSELSSVIAACMTYVEVVAVRRPRGD
jgi:hypothetical protein